MIKAEVALLPGSVEGILGGPKDVRGGTADVAVPVFWGTKLVSLRDVAVATVLVALELIWIYDH